MPVTRFWKLETALEAFCRAISQRYLGVGVEVVNVAFSDALRIEVVDEKAAADVRQSVDRGGQIVRLRETSSIQVAHDLVNSLRHA